MKTWKEVELRNLIYIGFCGLHLAQGAFENGSESTDRDMMKLKSPQ